MSDLIERLEKQPRWSGMPVDWPTPQEAAAALRAAQERERVLAEALSKISELRPSSERIWHDGEYRDSQQIAVRALVARAAIPSRPEQPETKKPDAKAPG